MKSKEYASAYNRGVCHKPARQLGERCSSRFCEKSTFSFYRMCTERYFQIVLGDGCFYQNRNVTLSKALLTFAEKYNITIEQKYLISGHTQMECDATHSLIERKIQKKEVNLPSQFVQLIKEARKVPSPLQVTIIF